MLRMGRYKLLHRMQNARGFDGWCDECRQAQGCWVEVGAGPEGGKFVALGGQLCCYAGMPLVAREREVVADSHKSSCPSFNGSAALPVNLLYDIEVDPSELHDMAATRPDVVQTMLERLAWYNESNVDCCICTGSEPTGEMRMAPRDGYWTSFRDQGPNPDPHCHLQNEPPVDLGRANQPSKLLAEAEEHAGPATEVDMAQWHVSTHHVNELVPGSNKAPSAPPVPLYQVFTDGERDERNQSYGCFRVPALVRTRTKRLLAFVEGRNPGARAGTCRPDVGKDRPILVRASDDDGMTWSDIRVAAPADPAAGTNYPSPFVVGDSVVLFYQHWTRGLLRTSSEDDGVTWSAQTPVKLMGNIRCSATFGAALLPSGRLVLPCGAYSAISDDGGESWRRSHGNVSLGPRVKSLGEAIVRADGRADGQGLSMFIRVSPFGGTFAHHALALSDDGGDSWGEARLLTAMQGATCQGAIGHNPTAPAGALLLSAPTFPRGGLGGRRNMSVWSLNASRGSAEQPALRVDVWPAAAGYSMFETSQEGRERLIFEAGSRQYDWGVKLAWIHSWEKKASRRPQRL